MLIATNKPHLICCGIGYNAVVRISNLGKKFPDDPRRSAEKHSAYFSRTLAGRMAMHPDDLEEMLEDFYQCGLKPRKEFFVVEGGLNLMFHEPGNKIDVGVPWLEGFVAGIRFFVRLK